MPKSIEYSVVIPCYNSDQSLVEIVEGIDAVFTKKVKASYEIVMVDDGSSNPKTWETITSLAKKNDAIVAARFVRNFGNPNAIICGFEMAQGEYIITMDDDLQHDPADIPLLVAKKEHDLVIGSYPRSYKNPLIQAGSWLKDRCDSWITKKPRHIRMSPFRLMNKIVAKAAVDIRTPYPFVAALLFYVTRDIVSVDIEHHQRKYGDTTYSFWRRVSQFSRLVINNSSILLKMVAYVGAVMSVISPTVALYLIIRKAMFGLGVPGWTSLMIVVVFFSGLILVAMGIIGEYLIRIIRAVEGRPAYIIRDKIGSKD